MHHDQSSLISLFFNERSTRLPLTTVYLLGFDFLMWNWAGGKEAT